jgi:two-component system response regulator LytT
MKIMIAEDERLAREELIYLLSKEPDVTLLPSATNGDELLSLAEKHEPDVIFLDIHMPGSNGMQAAEALLRRHPKPQLVFATAYDAYAVEAFQQGATDYLLKPYDEERLRLTLQRLRDRQGTPSHVPPLPSAPKGKLLIEGDSRTVIVDPASIAFAEKEEKQTRIHMTDGQMHLTKYSLQELQDRMQGHPFFRTHRSYLVNVGRIAEIEPWFNGASNAILSDAKRSRIPISRIASKELLRLIQEG